MAVRELEEPLSTGSLFTGKTDASTDDANDEAGRWDVAVVGDGGTLPPDDDTVVVTSTISSSVSSVSSHPRSHSSSKAWSIPPMAKAACLLLIFPCA